MRIAPYVPSAGIANAAGLSLCGTAGHERIAEDGWLAARGPGQARSVPAATSKYGPDISLTMAESCQLLNRIFMWSWKIQAFDKPSICLTYAADPNRNCRGSRIDLPE